MVWQFGRYNGVPTFDDHIDKNLCFSVYFVKGSDDEDDLESRFYDPIDLDSLYDLSGDFYLDYYPVFEMYKRNIPHSNGYFLFLDDEQELIRMVNSEVKDDYNKIIDSCYKKVGDARYEDFLVMGKYMASRFNKIAEEIIMPEYDKNVESNVSRFYLSDRKGFLEDVKDVDKNRFLENVGQFFYDLYTELVDERKENSRSNLKFNKRQIKKLKGIVSCLNIE